MRKDFQIAPTSLLFLNTVQEERNIGNNPSVCVQCGRDNI